MMLFAALLPISAHAAARGSFSDVTTYRLSPKDGKASVMGLTNVDSGDAGGDTLFGLSNLLLPQVRRICISARCVSLERAEGGEQEAR